MNRILWTLSMFSLTSTLTAAGCASQVDSDYPGESLATLSGMIINERSLPTPAAHASVFWIVEPGEGENGFLHGDTIEVSGDFPAQFTLDLFDLPPEQALEDATATNPSAPADLPRVAIGMIAVTDRSPEQIGDIHPDGTESADEAQLQAFLGVAEGYILMYSEAPSPAWTSKSGEHITALAAGYNLVEIVRPTPEQYDAATQCWYENEGNPNAGDICPFAAETRLAPGGLSTQLSVHLVDDYQEINFPIR